MKCSGENVILRGIFHVVSRFPLHFMFYRGNFDFFSNSELPMRDVLFLLINILQGVKSPVLPLAGAAVESQLVTQLDQQVLFHLFFLRGLLPPFLLLPLQHALLLPPLAGPLLGHARAQYEQESEDDEEEENKLGLS